MPMAPGPAEANGLPPNMGGGPYMPPGSAHARSTGPEGRGTLRQQYDGPPRGANGLVALDVILQGNQQGGQVHQTNPSIQKYV